MLLYYGDDLHTSGNGIRVPALRPDGVDLE